jgi:protein TonB
MRAQERTYFIKAVLYSLLIHGSVIALTFGDWSEKEKIIEVIGVAYFAEYDPLGGEAGDPEGWVPVEELFDPEPLLEPEIEDDPILEELLIIQSVSAVAEETIQPPLEEKKPVEQKKEKPKERKREARNEDRPHSRDSDHHRGDHRQGAGAPGQGRGGDGTGKGRGTKDPLAGYVTKVTRRLEQHKKYPRSARNAGRQGKAIILFKVNSKGKVLSAKIVQSTGHQILDDEVMSLINRAQPLPSFPPELEQSELTIRVPLDFSLS